jgi:hypothetical protein
MAHLIVDRRKGGMEGEERERERERGWKGSGTFQRHTPSYLLQPFSVSQLLLVYSHYESIS